MLKVSFCSVSKIQRDMSSAIACSKYKPRKLREEEQRHKDTDIAPLHVKRKDLSCEIPPEVRQFPPKELALPVGALRPDSAATVTSGRKPLNANFYGQSPRPLYRHGEVEYAQSSATPMPGVGAATASSFRAGTRQLPPSYNSADWRSVTKSEFVEPPAQELPTKELQDERKKNMRSSAVTVGDPTRPFERSTQTKDALVKYDRDRYTQHSNFPIGGPHRKNASSLAVREIETTPSTYQTLAMRQFPKYERAEATVGAGHNNKADMNRSHFAMGIDKTDYRTTAVNPLETFQPLLKGRPPSATTPANNPFAVRTVADARPKQLDPREVAASKARSSVPLSGGNALPPEVEKDLAGRPQSREVQFSDTGARCLPRTMTTTQSSFPAFHAKRREAINNCVSTGEMSGSKSKIQSSINVGNDQVSYVPATRSQFKGIYLQ